MQKCIFKKWNYDLLKEADVTYITEPKMLTLAVDEPLYEMASIELNYVVNRYGSFLNFDDILIDYSIVEMKSTPIEHMDFSHLLVAFEHREDKEKIVALNFIIDLKNNQNLINVPELSSIEINGYIGEMTTLESEETDEDRVSINLLLYDTDINGKYGFQSENCSESELIAIAKNIMRMIKITN